MSPKQGVTEHDPLQHDMDIHEDGFLSFGEDDLLLSRNRRATEGCGEEPTISSTITVDTQLDVKLSDKTSTEFTTFKSQFETEVQNQCSSLVPGLTSIILTDVDVTSSKVYFDLVFVSAVNRDKTAECLNNIQKAKSLNVGKELAVTKDIFMNNAANQNVAVVCLLCTASDSCLLNGFNSLFYCGTSAEFPYGDSATDLKIPKGDDESGDVIQFPAGIPFQNQLHYSARVNTNGFVSFGEDIFVGDTRPFPLSTEAYMFAPYWVDADTTNTGDIYYQLYDKTTENPIPLATKNILQRATEEVRRFADHSTFEATTVLTSTWDRVGQIGSTDTSKTLTFQSMLVSDGFKTYSMVFYLDLKWDFLSNTNIVIGYGSNIGSYSNVHSGTQVAQTMNLIQGNTGSTGVWFYGEIGQAPGEINYAQTCLNWYHMELASLAEIVNINTQVPQCPCNKKKLAINNILIASITDKNCYLRNANGEFGTYTRMCCFDKVTGGRLKNKINGGHLVRYDPETYPLEYQQCDLTPYIQCCIQSNLCDKFVTVRPVRSCNPSGNCRFASGFGDPHMSTLDGRQYTFNGLGEYTCLKIDTAKTKFDLQMRTLKARDSTGAEIEATIYGGFAVKESVDTTFQVELDPTRSILVLYAMSIDLTRSFMETNDFTYKVTDKILVVKNSASSVSVSFNSGISLRITLVSNMLNVETSVPFQYNSTTKGLLGNFDEDKTNDLTDKSGTTISDSSSDKQIFNMAKTWAITETESVFIYSDGLKYKDYNFPDYVPLFIDDFSGSDKSNALLACGSASNSACIYDFLATKDSKLAAVTKATETLRVVQIATLENNSPILSSSDAIFKVTVGETSILNITGKDDENNAFTYNVTNQPSTGFSVVTTGTQLQLNWTPADSNAASITVGATDDQGSASPILDINIFLCTGCSNKGSCSSNISQSNSNTISSNFQLAKCDCVKEFTGANCEKPVDFCLSKPCDPLQTCSVNLTAALGYSCSACPDGYNTSGLKCIDVDECTGINACDSTAECLNTEGSYKCICAAGYRSVGRECRDVDECTARTHDCSQICTNIPGSFNCSCHSGSTLDGDGKNCTQNVACTKQCQFTCESAGGNCTCPSTSKLKDDGLTCEDINECEISICSQKCTNADPGFACSCYDGYKLGNDKLTCSECELNKWGASCEKTCECKGRGTCNNIRGCLCSPEWKGDDCSIDFDECTDDPNRCGAGKLCVNSPGGYRCECAAGFKSSGTACVDVNECADFTINNCNQTCVNTPGSYYCGCFPGYVDKNGVCEDIDECTSGVVLCEQVCSNAVGSYSCFCNFGFQINIDRKTCSNVPERDPCSASASLGCQYACRVNGTTPECYCKNGEYLAADKKSCLDVDECSGSHGCSDTCTNTPGSYKCSCPVGKTLANDDRTCKDCPLDTWGGNCANNCSCNPFGSNSCNRTTGCDCKSGWSGATCADDINECDTLSICSIENTVCKNSPGSYACNCISGYTLDANRTQCDDINECEQPTLNTCEQTCTNTNGSFQCSCNRGFLFNSTSNKCQDIDECATNAHRCEQTCVNNDGSFRCTCGEGFKLNSDRQTCAALEECVVNTCDHICARLNNTDTCSCRAGYLLNNDATSCSDINECTVNGNDPCVNGICENNNGSYTCNCKPGYKNLTDEITCQECPDGTFGNNCASTCLCDQINTVSCSKTDGSCTCKTGWQDSACNTDIDECTQNATICSHLTKTTCVNTNGSFVCSCNIGHFSSDGICKACDDTHFGTNCASVCTCKTENSASCDKATGACTCKSGWQGGTCETDKDECTITPNICGAIPNCKNVDGTYECYCNAGYTKNNTQCDNIDECLFTNLNTCTQQGQTCNDTVGSFRCDCLPGYIKNGNACQDIIECSTNNGGCQETCANSIGSFQCSCPQGQTVNPRDTTLCYVTNETAIFEAIIILNITNKNDVVNNPALYAHRKLKEDIGYSVITYLQGIDGTGIIDVTTTSIKVGSVIADVNILRNTSLADSSNVLAKALYDLLQNNKLNVNGVQTDVLSPLKSSGGTFTKDSSTCDILAILEACKSGEVCEEEQGTPRCNTIADNGPNEKLIIGLAIGIPLLLFAIIGCIVYTCMKRRHNRTDNPNNRSPQQARRPFQSIFAGNVPKRGGWTANRYSLYSPDSLSQVSTQSSSDGKLVKSKNKAGRLDFRDSAWHDNASFSNSQMPRDEPPSNFSWEFMFRALEPMQNFEIQRPRVARHGVDPLDTRRPDTHA